MISHKERAELTKRYAQQALPVTTIVAKCGACLIILALIALIGAGVTAPVEDSAQASAAAPATVNF